MAAQGFIGRAISASASSAIATAGMAAVSTSSPASAHSMPRLRGNRHLHARAARCPAQEISTGRCGVAAPLQRRAASSSSSSSSPSAAMVKFQSSASQSKARGRTGDEDEEGDRGTLREESGQAASGTGSRSKTSLSSKAKTEDEGSAQESDKGRHLSEHSTSSRRTDAALATSAGPPSSPRRSDVPAAADEGLSWADVANPRTLVAHLDTYVIGQARAKKALSVAVFNHYVRLVANIRAKVDAEERAMAQRWEAERVKESGLSKRLQSSTAPDSETVTGSSSRMGLYDAPSADVAPNASQRSSDAPTKPSSRTSDKTKGTKRGKSGDPANSSMDDKQTHRSAEDISTDHLGQTEGPSPSVSDSDFGYFSSNDGKMLARTGLRKKPSERRANAVSSVETKVGSSISERHRTSARGSDGQQDGSLEGPRQDAEMTPASLSSTPRQHVTPALAKEDTPRMLPPVEKANVLLLGPTGSGKTLLLRTLASALHVPFVHIDATPLTQAGYVGEDVESIVQRLLVASGWDAERAGYGIVCIDEVDKLAARRGQEGTAGGRDVGGEGVQQALLRLLEGSVVTITDKSGQGAAAAASSSASSNSSVSSGMTRGSLAVALDQVPPWWPGGSRMNATQGPRATAQDESQSTSVTPTGRKATNTGLPGFSTGERSSTAVSTQNGVFNVDTSSVLFVLCGAFVGLEKIVRARLVREGAWPAQSDPRSDDKISDEDRAALLQQVEDVDLQAFGLIPEFVGRVPVIAALSPLSQADLVRVLTEPRNSLVSQYESLFSSSGVSLKFSKPSLRAIAAQAATKSTGARGLRRIMEDRLLEAMYLAPGSSIKYALLDEQAALGKAEVQLYSRGGKMAWLAAAADDDARKGIESRITSAVSARTKDGSGATISVHGMLRRKARIRLVRPSRLGHFRLRV